MRPDEQVDKGNPWYTSDQMKDGARGHTRRTVSRRVAFIDSCLDGYHRSGRGRLDVLDAGCGDGLILLHLVQRPNMVCTGLDYNLERVRRARQNVPQAAIRHADLTDTRLAHGAMDAIVLNQVLEHIEEDEKVLKTLADGLQPGGLLILGVPNEGCFLARLRNRFLAPSIGRTTDHVNFYTSKTIREKVEAVGLRVIREEHENFFWPRPEFGVIVRRFAWGRRLEQWLARLFPSQAAGLLFHCERWA